MTVDGVSSGTVCAQTAKQACFRHLSVAFFEHLTIYKGLLRFVRYYFSEFLQNKTSLLFILCVIERTFFNDTFPLSIQVVITCGRGCKILQLVPIIIIIVREGG